MKTVPKEALPDPVLELCRRLGASGHGAWLVGGGLRDVLLGKQPKDWDIATSATPEEVMKVFRRVIPTGLQHGTVTVLHRDVPYEVTTLRGEGAYSDSRRPDSVHFVSTIEEDLARRDFTVNAIAFDPERGRLIDPFCGIEDMDAKRLRTVGDAAARFGEDGLRVLRAARFVATLEFALDQDTARAIPGALGAFAKVSAERVRDEWMKALLARKPSLAFEVMRETGILSVSCPDLVEQYGCAQNRFHAYDVWGHSMACMDACACDPVQRLAGLLHDIGKPNTRALSDKTGDYTFYLHERVGADMADAWLRNYRFSNEERKRVVHLVRHHLVCYSPEWTGAAVRRFVKRVGPEQVPALLSLARADIRAKGKPVETELVYLDELEARIAGFSSAGIALSVRDLAISGRDLIDEIGLRPSPLIGKVLDQLMEQVLDEPELNSRETLLAAARTLVEQHRDSPP